MTDEERRIMALKRAVQSSNGNEVAYSIVKRAREFYNYLNEGTKA